MPLRNSLLHSIDSSMRFMPAALRNHMLLLTRLINNVVFMVNSITD